MLNVIIPAIGNILHMYNGIADGRFGDVIINQSLNANMGLKQYKL